jgi:hypothetical protein
MKNKTVFIPGLHFKFSPVGGHQLGHPAVGGAFTVHK